jgi:hypothetical protein
MYPFEAKQINETWASRIVNRDNLWLEAGQKEDDGDIFGAVLLYLKDALACVKSHNLPRAALSISCAAQCLEKKGYDGVAQILYAESASTYEEHSIESLDSSIRDAIWSLQRAYENYVLARDEQKATEVYYLFTSMASKLSPTYGRIDSSDLLKYRELVRGQYSRNIPTKPPEWDMIMKLVRGLLERRKSHARLAEVDRLITRG